MTTDSRKLLADWWTETWNAGGGDFIKQSLDDQALVNDLEYGFNRGGFAAAPVVVVVCADTERVPEIYAPSSIYPAVQNLLLAAADLGYGSCLTTGLTTFGVDRVRERLAAARHVAADGGHLSRAGRRRSSRRHGADPPLDVTYREKFGAAW